MKNLSEKGLLLNLKISLWSGRKDDKQIAKAVEAQHHTTNAGNYKKNLIDCNALKVVQSSSSALRKFHIENTLPWGDNGDRLVNAQYYQEYCKQFRELHFVFEDAVKDFLKQYVNLVGMAQRHLKTMFRPADYPSDSEMKKKFGVIVSCQPIARLDDFRVQGASPLEIETLRSDIQAEYCRKVAGGTKDIWDRINAAVGHMLTKLSEGKPKFHDTLVTNIRDLVNLLPKLDITNDPDIKQAINGMKSLIIDPETLRANSIVRSKKAKEAQALLSRFDGYMN